MSIKDTLEYLMKDGAYYTKETSPKLFPAANRELKDGEPCEHSGCLNHISHPCEKCGRINGKELKIKVKLDDSILSEVGVYNHLMKWKERINK